MARWAISDALVMTRRNLLVWMRVPAYIVFTVVQPVIFVLLFRYVFGGAIQAPGSGGYVSYLMPGIIGQTAAFATFATAIALAQEATKGVIDRFRAMPIARSAVLAGRLIADSIRMLIVILVIIGVGYAVGFRFQNGVAGAVGMVLLAEAFGVTVCSVSAFVGLAIKDEESVQAFGLIWIFPSDVYQLGVRADPDDARLAPGLREQSAGDARDQRHARHGAGRPAVPAQPGTVGKPGVARGRAARVHTTRGAQLPARRVGLEASGSVRGAQSGWSVVTLYSVAEVVVQAPAVAVGAADGIEEVSGVVILETG